ncbi:hypothetical protein [Neotabrizicola shimadae]|uniref:Uncharacterized protein n=1 Tax=Neotabrizicola shimadae TaxID=2807096 RepID=A0A8G0ZQG8_9RHOB|nr:hypothetical protein [Neotabrizicola shimadae]QYZ69586.1 hypothetical protein JO391_17980 [Neotabrizicola shimadae]
MFLAAKILLTLATLGYSAIPFKFDSNETHWYNPSWTPHGRFHCVWQVMSYVYIGVVSLVLIWTADSADWHLWLPTILAACIYGGFWTAVWARGKFNLDIGIVDRVNPVPAFAIPGVGRLDANITLFSSAGLFLVAGAAALAAAA